MNITEVTNPRKFNTVLRCSELMNDSEPDSGTSAVYFLIKDDVVVYVGQSSNVYKRIRDHNKPFDKARFIPVEPNDLDIIESIYIETLRPTYQINEQGNFSAPLKGEALIDAILNSKSKSIKEFKREFISNGLYLLTYKNKNYQNRKKN